MDAIKFFAATDNTRGYEYDEENSEENSADTDDDFKPPSLDTVVSSTTFDETSVGVCEDVVNSFSAVDKSCTSSSVTDADDGMENTETTVLTPNSSVRVPKDSDEGKTRMFVTPGDIPPQVFVHVDKVTTELVDLRADLRDDFRVTL
jgi:hypothetical protein